MHVDSLSSICDAMRSGDPRRTKTGIQAACAVLERRTVAPSERAALKRALSVALDAGDVKVRRWIYKLIALLRDPTYLGFLVRQLADREPDRENRTWAYCAVAALTQDHERVLVDAGDSPDAAYALAAAMYGRVPLTDQQAAGALDSDDPLAHQWIGLVRGNRRLVLQPEAVRDLITRGGPDPVEYLIWSQVQLGSSVLELPVDPFEIGEYPENIRRWFYRGVASIPESRDLLAGQVADWMRYDRSSLAREGLAFGLTGAPRDDFWEDVRDQWAAFESDPYVRDALDVPSRDPKSKPKGTQPMTLIQNGPVFYGSIGSVGAIAGRDIGTLDQSWSLTDPASLAQDLLREIRHLPAIDTARLDELQAIAAEAAVAASEQRPGLWDRLASVATSIKTFLGLTVAAGEVITTIETIAGMQP